MATDCKWPQSVPGVIPTANPGLVIEGDREVWGWTCLQYATAVTKVLPLLCRVVLGVASDSLNQNSKEKIKHCLHVIQGAPL